ncbi:MAG TPA: DUF6596 domain-containing protein, partial [Stellaceae bacterium]
MSLNSEPGCIKVVDTFRQASRLLARVGPDGALVPLTEQNRAHWDQLLIRRGLDALAHAEALEGDGPYVLQAALAACHAR